MADEQELTEPSKKALPVLGRVKSEEELEGLLLALTAGDGRLLLFRGQNAQFEKIRSSKARPDFGYSEEIENGWLSLVRGYLDVQGEPIYKFNFSMALLQHYGVGTNFLDVTANPLIAVWFATHKFSKKQAWYMGVTMRHYEQVEYERLTDGISYVFVFAVDDADLAMRDGHLVCLSHLPDGFLRPHRQEGWLLFDAPPITPNPNELCIGVIEVENNAFGSRLSQDHLFPSPIDDTGYASFRDTPFVQFPVALTTGNIDDDNHGAKRALSIDDYGNIGNDKRVGHKWQDLTLYEPHAVRTWSLRHFPLEKLYEGIKGDICDSTKITISQGALERLEKHADDTYVLAVPRLVGGRPFVEDGRGGSNPCPRRLAGNSRSPRRRSS
ncbi:MAG: hypothetical protein JWM80_816, partial [Cyanobacteria bacterium RYN_339]|nr:hypothetical protein [Cyanobacteria bacterium RYN_339]